MLLGCLLGWVSDFAHAALTLFGRPFQDVELFLLPLLCCRSRNPGEINLSGLGFSAFARHYLRNHCRFLFLGLLRCFTSPRSLSRTMNSSVNDRPLRRPGFPIRTPSDQSLLAAPRGLSQLAASFIASRHLGIHRMPLVA